MRNINIRKMIREEITNVMSGIINDGRVTDFKLKYQKFPSYIPDILIRNDPSRNKNHKYLLWMGDIINNEIDDGKEIREDDLYKFIEMVGLFDKKVKGVDIRSFKDLDTFSKYMEVVSGTKSKRSEIEAEGVEIFNNKRLKIVAPETHRACKFYGGGTAWCIATSSPEHWDDYYNEQGNSVIIIYDRKTWEKFAIVDSADISIEHCRIYDDQDNTIDNDELIALLRSEKDAEGISAYERIDDYRDNDDGDTRRSEWEEKKLADRFDKEGVDIIKDELEVIIRKEKLTSADDDIDDWDSIFEEVLGKPDGNKYLRFFSTIWYDTAYQQGSEMAGYFDNLKQLKRYINDGEVEDQLDKIVNLAVKKCQRHTDIDNIIRNMLTPAAYDALVKKWAKEYTTILGDVSTYLDNILNSANQGQFSFGGRLKCTPRSFEELLKILKKLDYDKFVKDIRELTSGSYDRQKW